MLAAHEIFKVEYASAYFFEMFEASMAIDRMKFLIFQKWFRIFRVGTHTRCCGALSATFQGEKSRSGRYFKMPSNNGRNVVLKVGRMHVRMYTRYRGIAVINIFTESTIAALRATPE